MLVTVMSIALGVLIGTAAYHTTESGLRPSSGRLERVCQCSSSYHPTRGGASPPTRSLRSAYRTGRRRR